jgi:uncharacterized protein
MPHLTPVTVCLAQSSTFSLPVVYSATGEIRTHVTKLDKLGPANFRAVSVMTVAPARASVRFYAELNDHLAPHQRYQTLEKKFVVPASVQEVIESFGIPHTEVELVLVNGESSDFSRLVRDGDRVAVYPVFESLDITAELRVRPHALREPKFVLDVHLGRLAAYLRMFGFDSAYRNCAEDAELVRISAEQERILLTRDRGLLKHSAVTRGYWLRQTDSRRQAAEVLSRFDLGRLLRPFTRCMACNEHLRPISKAEILERVPTPIAARHEEFRECPACRRVYWQGSHYQRMRRWIEELE